MKMDVDQEGWIGGDGGDCPIERIIEMCELVVFINEINANNGTYCI